MNKEKLKARIGEIQTRREEIKAKGDAITTGEADEFKALVLEQEKLMEEIDIIDRADRLDARATAPQPIPSGTVSVMGLVAEGEPYALGEYLQDIYKLSTGRERSARFDAVQKKFKAAATGLNEGVPSDGGFLVGTDMASELFQKTYENAQLASRCRRAPISANSNSMTINGIDEKSRANGSRFGGIRGYWENEADSIAPTKPKFGQVNLKLCKVTAAYYATDEVLADAPFMQAQVNEIVAQELAFKVDDALISGTGVGQPLGYLTAPGLVTIAKETGQSADTIQWPNIKKMYASMPAWNKKNGVWVTNDECLSQLMGMSMPIGTAGVPVWLPANPALNQPYDTLLAKPLIYAEQASALGDLGDISFVDFSQIQLIDKGGVQGASSIHVAFLASEQVFRFVYRVDAQPIWKSPLTQYKGAQTQSPYITLAARA
jgi:HK97 family phage major capsid protein